MRKKIDRCHRQFNLNLFSQSLRKRRLFKSLDNCLQQSAELPPGPPWLRLRAAVATCSALQTVTAGQCCRERGAEAPTLDRPVNPCTPFSYSCLHTNMCLNIFLITDRSPTNISCQDMLIKPKIRPLFRILC